MKTYTLGMYEKAVPNDLSWREKLEAAKEAGYDFLEISIDETEEKLGRLKMSQKERQNLCRDMYETQMPIRSMCLSGHRKYPMGSCNPDTERRSMEIMEDAVTLLILEKTPGTAQTFDHSPIGRIFLLIDLFILRSWQNSVRNLYRPLYCLLIVLIDACRNTCGHSRSLSPKFFVRYRIHRNLKRICKYLHPYMRVCRTAGKTYGRRNPMV